MLYRKFDLRWTPVLVKLSLQLTKLSLIICHATLLSVPTVHLIGSPALAFTKSDRDPLVKNLLQYKQSFHREKSIFCGSFLLDDVRRSRASEEHVGCTNGALFHCFTVSYLFVWSSRSRTSIEQSPSVLAISPGWAQHKALSRSTDRGLDKQRPMKAIDVTTIIMTGNEIKQETIS